MSLTQSGNGSDPRACDIAAHSESPVRAFKMLANDFGRTRRNQGTPKTKQRHSSQQYCVLPAETPKNSGNPHNQSDDR